MNYRSRGISVTGYDPSLHVDVVKSDLTNRFSSCGKITDVFVLKRFVISSLQTICELFFSLHLTFFFLLQPGFDLSLRNRRSRYGVETMSER